MLRAFALAGLFAFFGAVAAAGAHAYVIETSPAASGSVKTAPASVSVLFDEPVTIEARDPMVVRDERGVSFPCAGGAKIDPNNVTKLVCTFAAPLGRGSYTVAWIVTSADTHPVHDTFSFGVDAAAGARAAQAASAYDPSSFVASFLRWLTIAGIAGAVGGIAFEVAGVADELGAVARRVCGIGVAVAAGASVLALPVQAAAASGTGLLAGLPSLGNVAFDSAWGGAMCARLATLAVIAVAYRVAGRAARIATVAAAVVLPLTLTLSGHATAVEPGGFKAFAILADWLHVTSAGVWGGGLAILVLGAGSLASGRLRPVISRFSALAIGSVSTILATGLCSACMQLGSLGALLGTLYGRLIIAKTLLLFPLLALGYSNYLRGGEEAAEEPRGFLTTVTVEAGIIAVILAVSAVLTGIAPPRGAV